MPWLDRFRRLGDAGLDERALRVALLAELARVVPFDAHVWMLTDPETEVGGSPVADVPVLGDLPELVRAKYRTRVARWSTLGAGQVVSVARVTGGDRSASAIWTAASRYGVEDIASTVFRDAFGCWGFLDLWRVDGAFTDAELDLIAGLSAVATPALRRSLEPAFSARPVGRATGEAPAVLLMSDELQVLTRTAQAASDLRVALPTEPGRPPVPASALNVAAQLLAIECGIDAHHPSARVLLGDGEWVRFAAARLGTADADAEADAEADAGVGAGSVPTIAVSVERLAPQARTELYARVVGLTDRETDVLRELVRGGDTRAVADRLFVSPHTVQDHLKSIFAKAGVRSRPALVARATGAGTDRGNGAEPTPSRPQRR